jgi:hypothetical protein
VDPAVIGIGSGGREREGESEPAIVYCRVEDSIRVIWIPRRRAMIVAGPSPFDGIAGLDARRPRIKVITAPSDGDIRRRRGGERRKD